MNSPNPYATVALSPEAKTIADSVEDHMSQWIDDRVNKMTVEFGKRADTVTQSVTKPLQDKFDEFNNDTSNILGDVQNKLNALQLKFSDPAIQQAIADLAAAVKAHQDELAKQKEQFRQYGAVTGEVAKKMLLAAL